jgi:hypothetical protein
LRAFLTGAAPHRKQTRLDLALERQLVPGAAMRHRPVRRRGSDRDSEVFWGIQLAVQSFTSGDASIAFSRFCKDRVLVRNRCRV